MDRTYVIDPTELETMIKTWEDTLNTAQLSAEERSTIQQNIQAGNKMLADYAKVEKKLRAKARRNEALGTVLGIGIISARAIMIAGLCVVGGKAVMSLLSKE